MKYIIHLLLTLCALYAYDNPGCMFLLYWLVAGYCADMLCLALVKADHYKSEVSFYRGIRWLMYVCPIMGLVGLIIYHDNFYRAFPQIPKIRSPFYYDKETEQ